MKTTFWNIIYWPLPSKYLFWIFLAALILSFSTLGIAPLPWFDEVFFADMTRSLGHYGGLYLKFSPYYINEEILTYGPVYFWVQLIITNILGLKVFTFRLLNFLSGLVFLFLFRNYLKKSADSEGIVNLLWLMLFLDPILQYNLHSGRMDIFALLLTFSGFLVFLKFIRCANQFLPLIAGWLIAAGFLTTPRILFFLLPAAIYLFYSFRIKHFRALMLMFFSALGPVLMWILFKFESPLAYIRFFFNGPGVASHIGPSGLAGLWRYHSYFFWYLLVVISVYVQAENWFRYRKVNSNALFFTSVIILFHLIVVERGPYSAMIVPFYAGLTFFIWEDVKVRIGFSGLFQVLWKLNLLLFLCVFSVKMFLGFLNYSKTSEQNLAAILPQSLLKGKKVVGSFEYYYLMNSWGCQFYGFQLGDLSHRIRFHFQTVDFDYLVLTREEATCHQMIEYSRGGKLEKILSVSMPETAQSRLAKEIGLKLKLSVPDYSAEIYRHVRK